VERGVPEHCSLPSFLTVFLPLNRLTFGERERKEREKERNEERFYMFEASRARPN
jgi:hypothetical protein